MKRTSTSPKQQADTTQPDRPKGKIIYVTIKNLEEWEFCCNSTAKAHYILYVSEFGKSPNADLTILEYAVLKEILPAELFLRLGINIAIYDDEQLELCMIKLKRRLASVKKERLKNENGKAN